MAEVSNIQEVGTGMKMITFKLKTKKMKRRFEMVQYVRIEEVACFEYATGVVEKRTFHVVSANSALRSINVVVKQDRNPDSMATFLYCHAKEGFRVVVA
ncbi:expressed unknown protein [Seminavis robusta]|uniref:Uncharacterized protein n=1 Tax=Seminavis robusta TaxID=568900 RepID=A0A9N8DG35_9STRA|nr:expressed unknown protein [Seminavis robusta]|eukprot:Sro75_g041410.1 n/a (99) ;mRNA; f:107467-107763